MRVLRWTKLIGIAMVLAMICVPFVLATGVKWNNHEYEAFRTSTPISWDEANSAAIDKGGHLVTIESADENTFVCSLVDFKIKENKDFWFGDNYGNQIGPWIGGYQKLGSKEPNEGWVWVPKKATEEPMSMPMGEPFWGITVKNKVTEPNNNGKEDYACIVYFGAKNPETAKYGWADYGGKTKGYIVEWDF